jgi:hypothetical protein
MDNITDDKTVNPDKLNESNLILPFYYKGKFKNFCEFIDAQGFKPSKDREPEDFTWLRDEKRIYRYLAAHINTLIDNSKPNSICFSYSLNESRCFALGIPAPGEKVYMKSRVLKGTEKAEEFTFYLGKISMLMFRTGIGFLIINIKHDLNETINIIADKSFSLTRFYTKESAKSGKEKELTFYYVEHDDKTKQLHHKYFSLTSTVNKLLMVNNTEEDKINVFPSSNKNECNIFHRIMINEVPTEEELNSKLYLLRRAFHSTFYTNKMDATVDNATDFIYQTHYNNYFSFCQRGLVCLYYPQKNREVFGNHFKNNVMRDYFFIYLFLLHERQALFYYNSIILTSRRNSGKLVMMKKKLINFRINYSYKVISDEVSYQNFYNILYQSFSLNDLNADIQDIIDRATEHQTNIHENSTNTALAILALFGIFSAFDSSMAFIDRLNSTDPLTLLHKIIITVICVMIALAIGIYIWLKKRK